MILNVILGFAIAYILPLAFSYILVNTISTDEFNNIHGFKNWSISIYRMGKKTRICFVPFINWFIIFRILFYRLFSK